MKSILLITILSIFSNITLAQPVISNNQNVDCDFAGEITYEASKLKKQGMSFNELKSLSKNIPDSPLKNSYMYYSSVGFEHYQSTDPYELGLRLCQAIKS